MVEPAKVLTEGIEDDSGQCMYQAGCYMGTHQDAWHMRELGDNKAQQTQ